MTRYSLEKRSCDKFIHESHRGYFRPYEPQHPNGLRVQRDTVWCLSARKQQRHLLCTRPAHTSHQRMSWRTASTT